MVPGGRIAEPAVPHFTESITQHGIRAARMKTGTPVRIDKRSIHFEDMERQDGENGYYRFSFLGEQRPLQQLPCWVCYTNEEVHETLRS
jgi:tRNA uridine 5-carboxymethylaminomethyl modification enzyme